MTQFVKVVMLGDVSVGKSSIISRFTMNQFQTDMQTTIGASFQQKAVHTQKGEITLQIWDTAGQERYSQLATLYYRSCHAVILVWDVSKEDTLQRAQQWLQQMRTEINMDNITVVLVANKTDLVEQFQIAQLKQKQDYFCNDNNIKHQFFSSAKLGENIEGIFKAIAEESAERNPVNQVQKLDDLDNEPLKKQGGCC